VEQVAGGLGDQEGGDPAGLVVQEDHQVVLEVLPDAGQLLNDLDALFAKVARGAEPGELRAGGPRWTLVNLYGCQVYLLEVLLREGVNTPW
jgi:hypothetical protein